MDNGFWAGTEGGRIIFKQASPRAEHLCAKAELHDFDIEVAERL